MTQVFTQKSPRPTSDQQLREIWLGCLECRNLPEDANFFLSGGDSQTAMAVLVRIKETFGVTLPLRTIFDKPTLLGLSAAIDEAVANGGGDISEDDLMALLPSE